MEKIQPARYEGYLWYSDECKPKVFSGAELVTGIVLDNDENPFIVEGNLWDAASLTSIMIRYIDGAYHVRKVRVKPEECSGIDDIELNTTSAVCQVATSVKDYLAHRIDHVKALRFLQYWEVIPDELCEYMGTLRPSKLVFIGFEK